MSNDIIDDSFTSLCLTSFHSIKCASNSSTHLTTVSHPTIFTQFNMAAATFLTLPTETRKMIYEQLLPKEVDFDWCQVLESAHTSSRSYDIPIRSIRGLMYGDGDGDSKTAPQQMCNLLKQHRVNQLHLLLTNKHITSEASLIRTPKIYITICSIECLRHFAIQTWPTEKATIGSFKVSIPLRDWTDKSNKEGEALMVDTKRLEDSKLEVVQVLKKHYKEVKSIGEKSFVASDDRAKESKEWVELRVEVN